MLDLNFIILYNEINNKCLILIIIKQFREICLFLIKKKYLNEE